VGDDDNPVVASAAAKSTSKPAALSSPSSSPPSAASPLAFNSTHAASRLQQLLLSGSATALHFERAIKHADPQRSVAAAHTRAHLDPRAFPVAAMVVGRMDAHCNFGSSVALVLLQQYG
jgi:hypothetical protein